MMQLLVGTPTPRTVFWIGSPTLGTGYNHGAEEVVVQQGVVTDVRRPNRVDADLVAVERISRNDRSGSKSLDPKVLIFVEDVRAAAGVSLTARISSDDAVGNRTRRPEHELDAVGR